MNALIPGPKGGTPTCSPASTAARTRSASAGVMTVLVATMTRPRLRCAVETATNATCLEDGQPTSARLRPGLESAKQREHQVTIGSPVGTASWTVTLQGLVR